MSNFFLHTYHEENVNWESTLLAQRLEIPGMEEELSHSIEHHAKGKQILNARNLKMILENKTIDLERILLKIQKQQQQIRNNIEVPSGQISLMDLLYQQEDLRDEVLRFEQEYIDFKQRVHQFFLTVP